MIEHSFTPALGDERPKVTGVALCYISQIKLIEAKNSVEELIATNSRILSYRIRGSKTLK